MRTSTKIRFAIPLLTTSIGAAVAAGPHTTPAANPGVDAQALARAKAKFAHALEVVDQFKAQAAAEGIGGDAWRFEMIGNLMKGSEANFASVSLARSYMDAMSASMAVAHAGNAVSNSEAASSSLATSVAADLGTATTDLVYVPISPCRVLDTRAGGAAVAAGTVKNYFFGAGNVGTGNCSVTGQIPGSNDTPAAFAANVTVDEGGLTGFGVGSYLQIYPAGGSTTTSFMNFGPGQVVANAGVISLNQSSGYFSVVSNAPTQIIVDTYGVFIAPQSTALDCFQSSYSGDIPVGLSTTSSPGCPATHSHVGGSCITASPKVRTISSDNMTSQAICVFSNDDSVTHNVTVSATCCRVPGRN